MERFVQEAGQQTQPTQVAQEQPHVRMAQSFPLDFTNTIVMTGHLSAKAPHYQAKPFMP